MDRGQRAYVPVRVPFAFRHAMDCLSWRKWDARRKHWIVPRAELHQLVWCLRSEGCEVRGVAGPKAVAGEGEESEPF